MYYIKIFLSNFSPVNISVIYDCHFPSQNIMGEGGGNVVDVQFSVLVLLNTCLIYVCVWSRANDRNVRRFYEILP